MDEARSRRRAGGGWESRPGLGASARPAWGFLPLLLLPLPLLLGVDARARAVVAQAGGLARVVLELKDAGVGPITDSDTALRPPRAFVRPTPTEARRGGVARRPKGRPARTTTASTTTERRARRPQLPKGYRAGDSRRRTPGRGRRAPATSTFPPAALRQQRAASTSDRRGPARSPLAPAILNSCCGSHSSSGQHRLRARRDARAVEPGAERAALERWWGRATYAARFETIVARAARRL